ncbi:MAG: integrase core domain-containing protein [Patescibacteria group bacterium]
MQSISLIELAWELHKAGQSADTIAPKVGKDRATVFRWFMGIRIKGIKKFLKDYQKAKKGRRQKRKTDPVIKARIYAIREKYRHCCGEKIRYWMKKNFGVTISVSTIYRILGEKYQLSSKYRQKNQKRGPVPTASKPREVVQNDTVDFGSLYAFTSLDIFTREASVIIEMGLGAKHGAMALTKQMEYFKFADLMQKDGGNEFEKEWLEVAKKYCNRIRTSRPYRKNEQSYIESFNRTLRKECLGWTNYCRKDQQRVQTKVNQFLDFYNNTRPHLSLNLLAPTEYLSHLR